MKHKLLLKTLFLLLGLITGITNVSADTYVKVTSSDDLVSGDTYILVEASTSTTYILAGNIDRGKYTPATTGFTISNDKSTITTSTATPNEYVLGTSSTYYTLKLGNKYLGAAGNNTNLRFNQTLATNNNEKWTISKNQTYGFVLANAGATGRGIGRNTDKIGSYQTSNYAQFPPCVLYKKQTAPEAPTFTPEEGKVNNGEFSSAFNLTISAATGCTLKYTTNGSAPSNGTSVNSNSTVINIPAATTRVRAIAIKNNVTSAETDVTYTYVDNSKETPTFTLSTTEITLPVGEDGSITLTTNSDGEITFTSSDPDHLIVDNTADSKVGKLLGDLTGDYTITVNVAASETYNAASGTVTVHVVDIKDMPYSQTFDSSKGDFTVIEDETLGDLWSITSSSIKASAYKNSTQNDAETWLLSPFITISGNAVLSFEHADQYFNSENEMKNECTLWIREMNGSWNQLTIANYPTYPNNTSKSDFVETSNNISLYSDKNVQIGFRYLGNSTKAGSWYIKNFKIEVEPVNPTFSLDKSEATLDITSVTSTDVVLTTNTDGEIIATSTDNTVATVALKSGTTYTITAVKEGAATITIASAATTDYNAAQATVSVTVQDNRSNAGISFAEDSKTVAMNSEFTGLTLTNTYNLDVTYSSSTESVATVDPSSGAVSLVAPGTTTITATFNGNATYKKAIVSYELTVTKARHTVTFFVNGEEDSTDELLEDEAITFPEIDPIAGKQVIGWRASAYDGVSASTPLTGTVTEATMSTADVIYYAVFATQKKLEGEIDDNMTITNEDFTEALAASYGNKTITKTVNNAEYTIDLNACQQSSMCQLRKNNTLSYIHLPQLPGDIVSLSTTSCKNTSNSNFAGHIYLKEGKANYTADDDTFVDENLSSGASEFSINVPAGHKELYLFVSTGLRISDLTITFKNTGITSSYSDYCTTIPVPETVNISAALNATWVAPAKMQFGKDVTVYTVAYDLEDDGIIRKYEVKDKIVPANGVVMLTSESATSADVTTEITNDQDNYATLVAEGKNQLQVSDGTKQGSSTTYVLAKKNNLLGFYALKSGDYVPAGKAYLEISNQQNAPQFLWFDGETTAIDSLNTERESLNNGAIYDLSGRRITNGQSLPKGIYVQNGKKFIVK